MKIILVNIAELLKTPPALSLIKALDDLGYQTIVCAIGNSNSNFSNNIGDTRNVKFEYVGESYLSNISLYQKLIRMREVQKKLWRVIDKYYDEDSLIWVLSDVSLKHLGKRLIGKKYVIQLLELVEDLYFISGNPLFKMDRGKYVSNAQALVECEYNRAHITKAWWNLPKLPFVLPNKPYISLDIQKNAQITSSSDVKEIMDSLSGKKIVLYQGNISKERPLDMYIKAVAELGEEWAFVMMMNGENPYESISTTNTYYIPFVAPPFHLEVTSHAFIGVLSYVPIKNSHSILNTLYCAPNKLWEYSKFGIPMIGNDLPALRYEFETKHIGVCAETMDAESIKKALLKIEENYKEYAEASRKFYEGFDYKQRVKEIIDYSMTKCGDQ